MAKFYYTRILLGKMTIDEVPTKWRAAVEELINGD